MPKHVLSRAGVRISSHFTEINALQAALQHFEDHGGTDPYVIDPPGMEVDFVQVMRQRITAKPGPPAGDQTGPTLSGTDFIFRRIDGEEEELEYEIPVATDAESGVASYQLWANNVGHGATYTYVKSIPHTGSTIVGTLTNSDLNSIPGGGSAGFTMSAGSIIYAKYRAVDASPSANVSVFSNSDGAQTDTLTGGGGATVWPAHTPSFTPVVPDYAGFTVDSHSGFQPEVGGLPNTYFVTSLTGTSLTLIDTRTYEGSLRGCFEHNAGVGKIIHILVSGFVYLVEIDIVGDDVIINGHSVRADFGLVIKTENLFARGTRVQMHGLRVYVTDEGSTQGDQRACLSFDPIGDTGGDKLLLMNCETYCGTDQNITFYSVVGSCEMIECVAAFGLYNSIHPEGPHGSGVLVLNDSGDPPDAITHFSMQRSVIAHMGLGRAPLTCAHNNFIGNNLVYNTWRMSDFFSFGTEQHNVGVGNLYVRGTDDDNGQKPLNEDSGEQPVGSDIYGALNRHVGYSGSGVSDSNQNSFIAATQGIAGSPDAGAVPDGIDTDWSTMVDPGTATQQKLDYVELFRYTCGVQRRHATVGEIDSILDDIRLAVAGAATSQGWIDEPSQLPSGNIPQPSSYVIDITDQNDIDDYLGGNEFPVLVGRDTVGVDDYTPNQRWFHAVRAEHYGEP